MVLVVKNSPDNAWDMGLISEEDPLEEGMEPTPVFMPEESQGWMSLAGYSPQGHKEWDATIATEHTQI